MMDDGARESRCPPTSNNTHQHKFIMKRVLLSLTLVVLCAAGALAQDTEPTAMQIWLDVRLWKQIVGEAVPYVPPATYPRPLQEFYAYKNAAR